MVKRFAAICKIAKSCSAPSGGQNASGCGARALAYLYKNTVVLVDVVRLRREGRQTPRGTVLVAVPVRGIRGCPDLGVRLGLPRRRWIKVRGLALLHAGLCKRLGSSVPPELVQFLVTPELEEATGVSRNFNHHVG